MRLFIYTCIYLLNDKDIILTRYEFLWLIIHMNTISFQNNSITLCKDYNYVFEFIYYILICSELSAHLYSSEQ
jgi:hypothetical protein